MWQCDNCGYRINGGCHPDELLHVCHPDGIARHQAERLDEAFAAFLNTPAGRFEEHYARRRLGEAYM